MKNYSIPIHRLAEDAIRPLAKAASDQEVSLQILADPELAYWFTPYPEPTHIVLTKLVQNLIDICPKGEMTLMIQTADGMSDTIRMEVQMDMLEHNYEDEADFSLAILGTDDISTEVNLLGIDCPSTKQYVLGYHIAIPLIKEEHKTGLLNQHANRVTPKQHENISILVVDDNEVNRMVANKFLTRWGMRAEHAINGQVAVNKVRLYSYDLILMDLEMPVMDGFQAAEAIRLLEEGSTSSPTPIIALSAITMLEARDHALKCGMNDYLTKPLDPPQLYNKIMHYVDTNSMMAATA